MGGPRGTPKIHDLVFGNEVIVREAHLRNLDKTIICSDGKEAKNIFFVDGLPLVAEHKNKYRHSMCIGTRIEHG